LERDENLIGMLRLMEKENVKVAVTGHPNVGKSSVINRLCKYKVCPISYIPGVTK
jgi:ribosome biogenesis GTPase A